ncbi:hypothetical protein [Singulisphaera acidiphila]|uniref:hypothetical protein n=1 Tax=Singulisphaera acidiphila TaxID=466153 RepID=UPI0012B635E9|nr:hypothetical protein [Singulisphaera acidiphila]
MRTATPKLAATPGLYFRPAILNKNIESSSVPSEKKAVRQMRDEQVSAAKNGEDERLPRNEELRRGSAQEERGKGIFTENNLRDRS